MAKASAVIFDVDGTLVDSVDAHARAWTQAFGESGVALDYGEVRHQIGKGGDQLLPFFLDETAQAEIGQAVDDRQGEIFKRDSLDGLKPFADVRALFERLKAEGIVCVLATSAKAQEASRKAQIAGIEDLAAAVTTADDADHSKPYPDIFLAALDKIAPIPAGDAVVIGDTPYDAQAAVRAGVRPIGVLSGGFGEDELRASGCIAVYADVADLLARLETSPILSE